MNKLNCILSYKSIYNSALPGMNLSATSVKDTDCKCLPDCELLQYSSEITAGRLDRQFSFNSMTFL